MERAKGSAPSRLTGIKEIARQSGVSIATVSRVMHGHSAVSQEVRQRVNSVIQRLGYKPNLVARHLRMQRTQTIGVIIPDIGNAYFSDAVRAVQDAAAAAGYTVLVVNTDGGKAPEEAALATLHERQVDGLILVSSDARPSPSLRKLVAAGFPVVAMDRLIKDLEIDHVLVNIRAGTREAVLHLTGLGRRRIALISGPAQMWTAAEKLRGYRDGLRKAGIALDGALVLPGDYTLASGERQAQALLTLMPRPDAVIVANNLMTLGAMRVLLRHTISMPRDLAIVGYDEAAWTDVVRPTLTIVSQPTYELGTQAVRALIFRIANPQAPPTRHLLSTQLIPRESTLGDRPEAGRSAGHGVHLQTIMTANHHV